MHPVWHTVRSGLCHHAAGTVLPVHRQGCGGVCGGGSGTLCADPLFCPASSNHPLPLQVPTAPLISPPNPPHAHTPIPLCVQVTSVLVHPRLLYHPNMLAATFNLPPGPLPPGTRVLAISVKVSACLAHTHTLPRTRTPTPARMHTPTPILTHARRCCGTCWPSPPVARPPYVPHPNPPTPPSLPRLPPRPLQCVPEPHDMGCFVVWQRQLNLLVNRYTVQVPLVSDTMGVGVAVRATNVFFLPLRVAFCVHLFAMIST